MEYILARLLNPFISPALSTEYNTIAQRLVSWVNDTKAGRQAGRRTVASIAVKRALGLAGSKEGENGTQRGLERPCRRPLLLQNVDANLAALQTERA